MGYADEPYNTTTHLLWFMGAEIAPDADPRYTWSPTSAGWWSGVLKGGSSPGPSMSAVAASTGVNPTETSYALYGHPVPLSVFGVGRIGGEIIAGPYIDGGLATFCISFGVPADPTGTRDIREIAFDSEVVWTASPGVTTAAGGTFATEAFTFRFYQGTLTQAADSVEIAHWGSNAVAYRPQILLWFEDLPIANTKFSKIPYVSAVIGDGTGNDLNFGEAFERIAASPFVEFDDFETSGITTGLVDGGLIFAQDADFLATIQQFGRFYRNWDILQTDKLRIVDRGSDLTADITLNKTRLMGGISINRQGHDSVSKDLELSTIDPDADFTIVPYLAQRPSDPIPVTTSVGKDTAYLPAIMDAATRASLATLALYHGEATRKTISGTAMAVGLEIEPGDLVAITDIADDFRDEIFKIKETTHGANNVVEFTAESLFNCESPSGCINSGHAAAFLARTSGLDATHQDAYAALLNGLDADGLSCKIDVLHVYATQNSTTALLNLMQDRYNGTSHGSPTFTTDRGFTGTNSSSTIYIDTGFNPTSASSPYYSRNSAHLSAWQVDNVIATGPVVGCSDGTSMVNGNCQAYIALRSSTISAFNYDSFASNQDNSQTLYGSLYGDSRGHFMQSRPNAGTAPIYRNGVADGRSATNSSANPNLNMYSLAGNLNGTAFGSVGQVAAVSAGGYLTPTEIANFYGHLRTYMTAVGVP